jgi:sterol desaturase/sphingolipid hydroxylase (fatty acid hydroxylase superfamily)
MRMLDYVIQSAEKLVSIFVDMGNRWFTGYLLCSLGFAYLVYWLHARKDPELKKEGFIPFAFPKDIWSHKGTKVDIAYFFLNKFLFAVALASMFLFAEGMHALTQTILNWLHVPALILPGTDPLIVIAISTALWILAFDFALWLQHYWFHRFPLLWEFHKVHHSAEVMTPFTAGRMHPVEEFAGNIMSGLFVGFAYSLIVRAFGDIMVLQLFQLNIVLFLFYTLGFHLRHSHVWMPYTGIWGKIFVSPAHHQLHHSVERAHWDRNMGFIFAFWDKIFGTLVVPERDQKITFGVNGVEEQDYDSVWKLYSVPFIKGWGLLRGKRVSMDPLPPKSGKAVMHPAE